MTTAKIAQITPDEAIPLVEGFRDRVDPNLEMEMVPEVSWIGFSVRENLRAVLGLMPHGDGILVWGAFGDGSGTLDERLAGAYVMRALDAIAGNVYANVLKDNLPSQYHLRKLGFNPVGYDGPREVWKRMFTFDLQLHGGGGQQTQQTNQTTNQTENANQNSSFQNFLDQLTSTIQNQQQTTGGVSGQTVAPGLTSGLAPVAQFYQNEMTGGLDPTIVNAAIQTNQNATQRDINNIVHNATPGTNTAGLVEDLNNQGIMGQAQLTSNLAGEAEGYQQAGAQGLTGTELALNPYQNYNSQTGTQTRNVNDWNVEYDRWRIVRFFDWKFKWNNLRDNDDHATSTIIRPTTRLSSWAICWSRNGRRGRAGRTRFDIFGGI